MPLKESILMSYKESNCFYSACIIRPVTMINVFYEDISYEILLVSKLRTGSGLCEVAEKYTLKNIWLTLKYFYCARPPKPDPDAKFHKVTVKTILKSYLPYPIKEEKITFK